MYLAQARLQFKRFGFELSNHASKEAAMKNLSVVSTNVLQGNDFVLEMNFFHVCGSFNLCISLQELSVLHFFAPHIHYAGLTLQRALLVA